MADFRVVYSAGSTDAYSDESTHQFNEAGLPVITKPDGTKRFHSPHGWHEAEALLG